MTLFIGGLTEGVNIPKDKSLDLTGLKNMIIVDTSYLLKNLDTIVGFAKNSQLKVDS